MKLNVGCGRYYLQGFINIDVNKKVNPDHLSDCKKLVKNFGKNVAEEIRSYHMIEHLPQADATTFLHQCYIVLEKGGRLYLELPDFHKVLKQYLQEPDVLLHKQRIFGMQRNQFDFHFWGYTYKDLRTLLSSIGFVKIKKISKPDSNKHGGPILVMEAFK